MNRLVGFSVALLSLVFAVALACCVSDQSAPVVAVDGGTIVDEASVVSNRFSLAGTVDGLPQGGMVTLTLNSANAISASDGPFIFPAALAAGQSYVVAASGAPTGYSCAANNGTGTVASANVTGVIVHCTSNDTSLKSLALSTGPLVPAFDPKTLAYTATVKLSVLFPSVVAPPTMVTATTNDPNATITVNGKPVSSGTPSAALAPLPGPNTIDVEVTASDGTTKAAYVITAVGSANDYIKATNTRAVEFYGNSVAVSSDGNTLAVGSFGDESTATGINGDENNTVAPMAGAVFIYRRASGVWSKEAYVKPSNTTTHQWFGFAVALSADGNTLAVGAVYESSKSTGVNGAQNDTSAMNAGAAYVFTRAGTTWTQQAYVKASNTAASALFGNSLALSGDGNTLAVSAPGESSNATGINGAESDTSAPNAGAVYVFLRSGTSWSQQAYVKSSNTAANQQFGGQGGFFGPTLALSNDGGTMAVGALGESSNATGIGGSQSDTSAPSAGAVYVFTRNGTTWSQQAYVKASNTRANASFGHPALSADGNLLAVGSNNESSGANTINGDQNDASAQGAGAVYTFTRVGTTWTPDAYIKASNARGGSSFGYMTSVSSDGNTLAVSAPGESSNAKGVGGDQSDTSASSAGAVYVFKRAAGAWSQFAYVKSSNTQQGYLFGAGIAISPNGLTLAVGAREENSDALGINGNQNDTSAMFAGAAYVY